MKIILSRKGLDSASGGFPSPILPDNSLCWIPIPGGGSKDHVYKDLEYKGHNIGVLVQELSKSRINSTEKCHLDPDLYQQYTQRCFEWRGGFGQCSVAQSHLASYDVSIGDLFLFFGWFRKAEKTNCGWHFVRNSNDMHIMFGWLQVGEKYELKTDYKIVPICAQQHTHYVNRNLYKGVDSNNTIYIGSKSLQLPDLKTKAPGFGLFACFSDDICLTAPHAKTRGGWRLPGWFFPDNNKKALSYHGDLNRWKKDGKYSFLRSVGRGQEFIIDCDQYPESYEWSKKLILSNMIV